MNAADSGDANFHDLLGQAVGGSLLQPLPEHYVERA